jgi:GNAT superfamily N-acetyltransferase
MNQELQISPLEERDLADALGLSTQAGWNQTQDDWRTLLWFAGTCLAGRIDGQVVATGTIKFNGNCGWIGMLLVEQRYRGRGYGSRMFDVLLKVADEMQKYLWLGLDATELGKPIYQKRGFREVGKIQRWQLAVPHQLPRLYSVREYRPRRDFERLHALDGEAFGAFRLLLWKNHLDIDECVCEKDDEFLGFGYSRPGRLGQYIGPVVARSDAAAGGIIAHLMERFAQDPSTPVFIDVPQGCSIEPWLKAEGFEVVRNWTRMVRGMAERGNPEMIFGTAGPEFG